MIEHRRRNTILEFLFLNVILMCPVEKPELLELIRSLEKSLNVKCFSGKYQLWVFQIVKVCLSAIVHTFCCLNPVKRCHFTTHDWEMVSKNTTEKMAI